MSKTTVHGSEKLNAMRGSYLLATFNRQESIARWKRLESARGVFKALTVVSILLGVVAAALLWFIYREAEGYREFLYAGIGLGAGVVLAIIFALIRLGVSSACNKAYVACYVHDMEVQEGADEIKSETLDPVLENSVVISIRSHLSAPVEYEDVDSDAPIDENAVYEYVEEDKKGKKKNFNEPEIEHFHGPVNSAIVFIDDVEVGAVDLGSEFSVFRVNPGLHTLKIKIRKEYAHYGKTLELQTPVNPIYIDGDYRILSYTLDAKTRDNVNISYALKLAEYDDMAIFRREMHNTDMLETLDRDADLSRKLRKRARRLYAKLRIREQYVETFRQQEEKRFLREKYNWNKFDDPHLDPHVLKHFRAEARATYQAIHKLQENTKISASRKAKQIANLEAHLSAVVHALYEKLNISGTPMTSLQEIRLKNILLFGQENVRSTDLAQELQSASTDARIKNPNKQDIIVNVHNTIHKDHH